MKLLLVPLLLLRPLLRFFKFLQPLYGKYNIPYKSL